ncbi:T9SS type A sorting domain-containing protein [Pontibacter locisalis]|uniref:T9SS type A sorting domain-containing protein n=1 Tax=Pontibacter locisalis TaxID=1719035 RepID=A0ABW5IP43_9BACT
MEIVILVATTIVVFKYSLLWNTRSLRTDENKKLYTSFSYLSLYRSLYLSKILFHTKNSTFWNYLNFVSQVSKPEKNSSFRVPFLLPGLIAGLILINSNAATAQSYICDGRIYILNSSEAAPNGHIFRHWEYSSTGVANSYTIIAGATNPNYTFTASLNPNNSGFYRALYTNNGGAQGWYYSIQLIVTTTPSAPSAVGASRCGPGAVTLSASGTPSGVTYNWYSTPTGGTSLATTSTYTTPSLSTTTTYYLTTTTGSCESNRTPVTATINTVPTAPIGNGGSTCGPGSVSLTASVGANGTTARWYAASSGGTVLSTGTSFTTPSISTTTTYYVSSFNTTTGCESTRTAVTATVNTVPAAPSATGGSRCGSGTVTLNASGSTGSFNWYSSSTGDTALATNTSSYTTPSISSTTTYYVAAINSSSCESSRTAVTATVNQPSDAPATTGASREGAGSVTLSASGAPSGGSYRWYTVNSGGTAIGGAIQANYTTPSLDQTTTYYVSTVGANGCESARTAVTATITPSPLPIQLAYFTGNTADNKVQLQWVTASEINNDRFEIERSKNGRNFEKIGTVKGNGNSAQMLRYNFTDANGGSGTVYYRLRQVDYNGEFSYSKVISFSLGNLPETGIVEAYPNPFNSELKMIVTVPSTGEVSLEIVNTSGKIVYTDKKYMLEGVNDVYLPLSSLSSGLYVLKLSGTNINSTQKVIKSQYTH